MTSVATAASGADFAVIVSPKSRHFRKNVTAVAALAEAAGGAPLFDCVDATSTETALTTIRDAGIGVIAVAGGDGTVGHVIGAAKPLWDAIGKPLPRIALLRGGTMNTVANGLGFARGKPEVLLGRLRETLQHGIPSGYVISRPTIDVGGRVGFLFGTGVFQSFLRAYYAKGNNDPSVVTAAETIGHIVASILVRGAFAKTITKMDVMQLETDGERWREKRFLAVAAGTVGEVGLGFKPFHRAAQYERAFHLIGLTEPASSVVFDLPLVWAGLGVRKRNGRDVVSREARLSPPHGGRLDYMVDGDLFSTHETLVLKTGPIVELIKL